eukprot:jgi/Psemu1/19072/gm1.19072_g
MPSTSQVFLPIHLPSVFHFVLHYKALVTNLYHIHFDFNKNIVTLSSSQIGKGKICLSPCDQEIASFDGACNEYISQGLCASILAENIALVGWFDNSYKAILQNHSLWIVDKEYKGFQCDDHLYIYPPPGGGVETQCSHVRFDPHPKELIKGSLEIPTVGCIHQSVTQFLCYNMNSQQKLHQWIFMEHIPYVFHEMFVTDPELEVVFLSRTDVQNIDEHFGKGNKVYLSGVFKHLEGSNFKYHTLSDFETWECFKDSKADLQNFQEIPHRSRTKETAPPCDNVSDNTHNQGNQRDEGNVTDGKLDNNGSDKTKDNVNRSDEGNVTDGTSDKNGDNGSDKAQDKVKRSDEGNNKDEILGNDGDLEPAAKPAISKELVLTHTSAQAQSQNGNNNELEQSVQLLNSTLNVTVPKFPLKGRRGFSVHDIEVMLKDPDPEIVYPIYQFSQKVVYVGDINCIGLVDEYVSKPYEDYNAYPEQCYGEKHGKSGKAQDKNKGNLLGYDEDLSNKSSSNSNYMSDNDVSSEYDPDKDVNSEVEEEDED